MRNKQVVTKSGLKGWQGRLQDQYECWDDFASCAEIYNLHKRLGYSTPQEAWDDNPVVQGSTNPSDYCKVGA